MKVKRLIANLAVLFVFAVAVFFIGYLSLRVDPGTCAIMESKTGGLYGRPIIAGGFTWRPECLLPTNVKLASFDLAPHTAHPEISGELAGGAAYSSFVGDGSLDFSYRIAADVSLSVSPEAIYALYEGGKIKSAEDLTSYCDEKAGVALSLLAEKLLSGGSSAAVPGALTADEISSLTGESASDFEGLTITSMDVVDFRLPDIAAYNDARAAYARYISVLDERMAEAAEAQAARFVEQDNNLSRMERLGELLRKYPELEGILQSGNISSIMGALRSAD